MKRQQQGVTLLEMALVIAMMSIVMTSLFPAMQTLLRQIGGLRGERFEVYVSQSLAAYYSNQFTEFVEAPGLLPAAAHFTAADEETLNGFATGAVSDLTVDFNNNTWHYSSCAITGSITAPIGLEFCNLVAYTTPDQEKLTDAVLATLDDAGDWTTKKDDGDIEQFVIFNGQHIVQRNLIETKNMVENVRDHLEDYYKNLVYSAEDQSFTINRFASTPNTSTDANIILLFDPNSVLENKEIGGDYDFQDAELEALGLTDGDITTPFGAEIFIDNGSADIRNPENGDSLPYTARVWTQVISGVATTEIESIAVSKF